jgi:hypothetical protein
VLTLLKQMRHVTLYNNLNSIFTAYIHAIMLTQLSHKTECTAVQYMAMLATWCAYYQLCLINTVTAYVTVAFKQQVLAICTQAPDTVKWRIRQILRWYMGGACTLCNLGIKFLFDTTLSAWPTILHRIFTFNW